MKTSETLVIWDAIALIVTSLALFSGPRTISLTQINSNYDMAGDAVAMENSKMHENRDSEQCMEIWKSFWNLLVLQKSPIWNGKKRWLFFWMILTEWRNYQESISCINVQIKILRQREFKRTSESINLTDWHVKVSVICRNLHSSLSVNLVTPFWLWRYNSFIYITWSRVPCNDL